MTRLQMETTLAVLGDDRRYLACPNILQNDSLMTLEIPSLLHELIDAGRWPRNDTEANAQNLKSLAKPEDIQNLVSDESLLFLLPPPFKTVRVKSKHNDFWLNPQADPEGIDFDLAIDIGGFGLGSDSPILLDYRDSVDQPKLVKLHWTPYAKDNRWVHLAKSFDEFVSILKL